MFSRERRTSRLRIGKGWACWLAVLAAFFCSTTSQAIAPTPMPLFTVQGLDGSAVQTSSWTLKGNSLLIYVRSNCRPCGALLGSLNRRDYPDLASHTIFLLGDASPDGAKDLLRRYPDLGTATWYLDPSQAAATALHLQGAPVILGLKNDTVQWAVSGVMQQAPAQRQSILNTWIRK